MCSTRAGRLALSPTLSLFKKNPYQGSFFQMDPRIRELRVIHFDKQLWPVARAPRVTDSVDRALGVTIEHQLPSSQYKPIANQLLCPSSRGEPVRALQPVEAD